MPYLYVHVDLATQHTACAVPGYISHVALDVLCCETCAWKYPCAGLPPLTQLAVKPPPAGTKDGDCQFPSCSCSSRERMAPVKHCPLLASMMGSAGYFRPRCLCAKLRCSSCVQDLLWSNEEASGEARRPVVGYHRNPCPFFTLRCRSLARCDTVLIIKPSVEATLSTLGAGIAAVGHFIVVVSPANL